MQAIDSTVPAAVTPTCPDCQAASERMHHGFTSNCRGCWARAVSRSPDFHRVMQAQWLDKDYLAMLQRTSVTHQEAKLARAIDKLYSDAGQSVDAQSAQTIDASKAPDGR